MIGLFSILPLWANLLLFALAAGLVWVAGTRLVYYSDELAERSGMDRAFVGLVFLAFATSLPEIVTTIAGALSGNAGLVLGNMIGGITMQTAILAFVDFFFVRYALTSWPRKPTHALEAIFLTLFLNVLLLFMIFGEVELFWSVGLGALFLFLGYPLVIGMLRKFDERASWAPVDIPESEGKKKLAGARKLESWTMRAVIGTSLLAAAVILVAGYMAAGTAEQIAVQTGMSSSFVGIALLAAATSMPELSTTIAAARMGEYTMAISNIFGSNLIMIALILPADVFYREGPILAQAGPTEQLSLIFGMLVTMIYVAGILIRKTPRLFGAGLDSVLVFAIYILSLFALFAVS